MKIILLFLFLMNCLVASFAQIDSSKWIGGLTLSGSSEWGRNYDNNTIIGDGRNNVFEAKLTFEKFLKKKWLMGFGLYYYNSSGYDYNPSQVPSTNVKGVTKKIGGFVQIGHYTEFAKNVFLFSIMNIGYNDFSYTRWNEYRLPTEQKFKQPGYEIISNLTPIRISYLFKKRYLLSLDMATIGHRFQRLNSPSTNSSYGKNSLITYSLNPIQNGITFSYLLK